MKTPSDDKYRHMNSGDEFYMDHDDDFLMMCCDCGLVHQLNFKVGTEKLGIKIARDNRRTANARRGKEFRHLKL